MPVYGWTIFLVAVAYVGLLFAVATWGDRMSQQVKGKRRPRPLIYALSIAVYCTSWTYFGSVGAASRTGYDFIPVYLGPILVFALGYPLISRVVMIAKGQNIASIADFIAARYGKSEMLGALVAIIAVIGIVPYISIQLKALYFSLEAMMAGAVAAQHATPGIDLAFFITVALAIFAMLFGTRHVDATEHQDGLMTAIAVESIVKLFAFLTVGLFVTFVLARGPEQLWTDALAKPEVASVFEQAPDGGRWLAVTFLSACAILLLPRQFHVTVVENAHGNDVRRAAWLFPLYLVVINLFVVPIAIYGLLHLPAVDGDTYVLAIPLEASVNWIALIASVGGISAATAMVIVETIALSIMVSNNVIVPLVLLRQGENNIFQRGQGTGGNSALVNIRRAIICAALLLAYVYYAVAGNSAALAQTGLISFAAVAQFAPAFFGGLMWKRGTAKGAMAGISAGFVIWAFTLLIPSFIDSGWLGRELLDNGLFGLSALRPRQLLGIEFEPLTHGVIWSLLFNIGCYVGVSLLRPVSRIEALQAQVFLARDLQLGAGAGFRLWRSSITMGQLEETVSRYLGEERARNSFAGLAQQRELDDDPKLEADIVAINHAEHLLASAVGPASSRLVMALLLERHAKGSRRATQLLDDATTAIQHSRDLLQTAIDNVPQGIAVFAGGGELVCWNPPFRSLLALPEPMARVGTPLGDVMHHVLSRSRRNAELVQALPVAVEALSGSEGSLRERLADGTVVDIHAGPLPDGGLVVTFTDVTESVAAADTLQRANETLEQRVRARTAELTKLNEELAKAKSEADQANQGKTRFLAAASHDILQPLNAARLFTSSLVERAGRGKGGELARNVDASLEAVEEILSTILDISRFDAGAVKPQLSSFAVEDILQPLRREFEPAARANGLAFAILPSSASVRSDRKLLRRILQNLISNAIKYTREGRVLVGCKRSGGSIEFRVYDTGLGIPEAQQKLIFREFERLRRDKELAPGLGLGLSIVERMCRTLRHPITMKSEVGKGSLFSVAVPIGRVQVVAPAPARKEPRQADSLAGLHVLAVDNEPAIIDGLKALLSGWGVKVASALSAAEAVRSIGQRKRPIDAILADYHIHRDDGIELVQSLRRRLGHDVPAVLITADHSPTVREQAEAAGIHVLRKPVKPAALRAVLAQLALSREAAE
jgi:Na+/proline symporter/signal transduction histidine kinase/ActR/RegA family two-component response regulator